ncbi:DUF881 domain-containing protein [Cumulibacter soli]|uniref:DUF881 domain-containing protein n=1 Tax=Cumulibacter soli TaxID=2546344 RepID=UPI001067F7B0|nr:DUF881 domain-containing protein [Cumulibacter soli]
MTEPDAADRWGLRTLMTRTLDPGYALAATGPRSWRRSGGVLTLVVVLIAGVLMGMTVRQHQRQGTDRQAANAALIERIEARQGEVGLLSAEAIELRAEVAELRQAALGTTESGQQLLDTLTKHEMAAGQLAVTGPGIEIVLDEPQPVQGNDPVGHGQTVEQDGVIKDTDLQAAVNALWASGAEAIAINGSRIGPITAIRQAGGAVLIDFQPTSTPYVIEVIGDPGTLPGAFATTSAARRFSTYRTAFGAQYEVHTADELNLPAAADPITAGSSGTQGGGK